MRIRAKQLKFPLADNSSSVNFVMRWIMRIIAAFILNHSHSYQFGGFEGANGGFHLVDVVPEDIAEAVLTLAGYELCSADVDKLTGNIREGPEGTAWMRWEK